VYARIASRADRRELLHPERVITQELLDTSHLAGGKRLVKKGVQSRFM
jgi:hypothetical protein